MNQNKRHNDANDKSRHGRITKAVDHGSIWQVLYETDDKRAGSVMFDHRPFAAFYEGATGGSFFKDYNFGAGREYISGQLCDLRISVEGGPFDQAVRLED